MNMAYNTPDERRRSVSRKYQGRAGESRGNGVSNTSAHRVQARGGSSSQYRNSRNRRSRNGGSYQLRSGDLRLNGRRGTGMLDRFFTNYRLLIFGGVGIILAIALILLLVSAVRGCASRRSQKQEAETDTETRVALTVSADLADRFALTLDRNDMLAEIAKKADLIEDPRLLELALNEPTAIEFVYGYLSTKTPTSSESYTDKVTVGTYPKLYNWDTRWGYVGYGDSTIAFNGSGPTAFTMAYMGLTGKSDRTPATFAAAATEQDCIDTVYDTKPEFFSNVVEELGLYMEEYAPSGENLSNAVQSGTVVLVQLRERSLTDRAHWALAVSRNLDGSINLYDPTSSSISEHPWDPDTIAAGADVFYALSASEINVSSSEESSE